MGKVGLLGFVLAVVTLLNVRHVISKWNLDICACAIFLFFSTVLLVLDLKRFFESPYSFRTKAIDAVLSTFLGDFFEDNRCWFNWKLNLYSNQFFAKEILCDKWEYPALHVCKDEENGPPSLDEHRSFVPEARFSSIEQNTWYLCKNGGVEDAWANDTGNLLQVTLEDLGKICFRFFNVGSCQIKVMAEIRNSKDTFEYKCVVQVSREGSTRIFAEHIEIFTEGRTVELLFAFFDEFHKSPLTGVIDVRKGGIRKKTKIAYCYRIQEAMDAMKGNRSVLVRCRHVDHGLWIL